MSQIINLSNETCPDCGASENTRKALVSWSAISKAWIVEDVFDVCTCLACGHEDNEEAFNPTIGD